MCPSNGGQTLILPIRKRQSESYLSLYETFKSDAQYINMLQFIISSAGEVGNGATSITRIDTNAGGSNCRVYHKHG